MRPGRARGPVREIAVSSRGWSAPCGAPALLCDQGSGASGMMNALFGWPGSGSGWIGYVMAPGGFTGVASPPDTSGVSFGSSCFMTCLLLRLLGRVVVDHHQRIAGDGIRCDLR